MTPQTKDEFQAGLASRFDNKDDRLHWLLDMIKIYDVPSILRNYAEVGDDLADAERIEIASILECAVDLWLHVSRSEVS